MMDRYTARALVEQGQMSSEEYLRLFGEEIRSARQAHRAGEALRKRELAAEAARSGKEQAGQTPEQTSGRSTRRSGEM